MTKSLLIRVIFIVIFSTNLLANKYYVLTLNNTVLCSGCSLPSYGNFYGYSLFSAINDANNHPGLDTIYFNKLLVGSTNLSSSFVGLVSTSSIPTAVASATSYGANSAPYSIFVDNNGYPDITDPVLIDAEYGFTGGGCGGTPRITIVNTSGSGGTPFRLKPGSNGTTIKGFSISGFATAISCAMSNNHFILNNYLYSNSGFGIVLSDASNCTILGNKIGFKPDGSAGGNGQFGILFDYNCSTCNNNTIGGNNLCDRNYISNNGTAAVALTRSGISIQGTGLGKMKNAKVINNFIGTDISGTMDMGNGENGIVATWCDGCLIENNVISGNQDHGIIVQFGQNNGIVRNNIIGADYTGTASIGNSNFGINVEGGTDLLIQNNKILFNGHSGIFFQNGSTNVNVFGNTISNNNTTGSIGNAGVYLKGGTTKIQIGNTSAEKNIISGNKGAGIEIDGSGSPTTNLNPIRQNSIFCNQGVGKGIVLINGGNNNYPAPVILSLVGTTISGTAPANSVVELFYDNSCPFCQGKDFIVSTTATAAGNWSVSNPAFTTTTNLTATATEPGGGNSKNTSAFSICSSVLPADFIHLSGRLTNQNNVTLNWVGENKNVINQYVVEKSIDAFTWAEIGTISEKQSISEMNRYEFQDHFFSGASYYRLKLIDQEGGIRNSNSIFISPQVENQKIEIHPNPANSKFYIILPSSPLELTAEAIIMDLQGHVIFEVSFSNQIEIPVEQFVPGYYIVKTRTASFEQLDQLIISN